MDGLFSIYSGLYGITVTPRKTAVAKPGEEMLEGAVEVWHPDVLFYDLHDSETGEHMGSFYADWHPATQARRSLDELPERPGSRHAAAIRGCPTWA